MLRPSGSKKSTIDTLIFTLVALSALVVGAGLLLIVFSDDLAEDGIFGSGEMEPVDFERLTLAPSSTHYLACHEDFCQNASPDEITEVFTVPVNELRDRLTRFIDDPVNNQIEVKSFDLQNRQFVFLVYTSSSPFPDVVTVKLYDLGASLSGVSILSQTLKGDDATNRNLQRVRRWLTILKRP